MVEKEREEKGGGGVWVETERGQCDLDRGTPPLLNSGPPLSKP